MPALPFKLNQTRRHHIPKQKHKVTNSAAYDAALRQRGSLTGKRLVSPASPMDLTTVGSSDQAALR